MAEDKCETDSLSSTACRCPKAGNGASPLCPGMSPTTYTHAHMEVLNLLEKPVWVFDVENSRVWWANTAAIDLWNAKTLNDLLAREFNDMSHATKLQMTDYLNRFKTGQKITETRVVYPPGKEPVTVDLCLSGITVDSGKVMMLNEGQIKTGVRDSKQKIGNELMRNLPVAVSQFDMEGNIKYQNPEASDTFLNAHSSRKRASSGQLKNAEDTSFLSRFVDQELGEKVMAEVRKGNDYSVETQLYTKEGPRWSSVEVCQAKDPVTGQPTILYSTQDITELMNAKKEAHEANARKTEFIAVMAHEIRTPLHQVTGFIELLKQTKLDDNQKGHVRMLKSSCTSLMAVINDLLDYTKLESGKMDLESMPFEPSAVLHGSVEAISARANLKGLTTKATISRGTPVKVVGDPNRLRQILLNLLNNAVKFTNSGSISTSLSTKPSKEADHVVMRFEVTDSGIGIRKERLEHVFQTYTQADASISRNFGGTGLGLTICERLVSAMNGKIGVESEVGKGSTFWFEIPFANIKGYISTDDDTASGVENLTGLEVLVAEDNKINQKVAKGMLERLGHVVTVVENGEEATKKVETSNFDLVLMDIQMPVLDGIEATKEIRSGGFEGPIVGLTASYQRSLLPFYREIGMDDCISKPVLLKGLRSKIAEHVKISSRMVSSPSVESTLSQKAILS